MNDAKRASRTPPDESSNTFQGDSSLPPLKPFNTSSVSNLISPLATWERETPLTRGILVRRYKRFFADVELESGEVVITHCVNTGAMEGLTRPGNPVWISRATNPARKLKWTWELAEINGRTWGVNTALPNRFIKRLLAEKCLPWLTDWAHVHPEKKYGEKSRVDFWLSDNDPAQSPPQRQHYLEVKNCHLLYPDNIAYFPDCVSTRATQHLEELVRCIDEKSATSAEVVFVVQVPGAQAVRPSELHDPAFATAARTAASWGVKFSAIGVDHQPGKIVIYGPVPVDLEPYNLDNHHTWREENR